MNKQSLPSKDGKKIRVGMDISQTAHKGGVAIYTKNLSSELSKIDDLDMVYFYSSLRKPYRGKLKNIKSYRLPPTIFELFFNKIRNVTIEKFLGPMDIFHSSDWTQPPTKALKVTTVHDLVPIKYPQWSHPKIVAVHKRRIKIVEKEIDMVIAVSQTSKKDLMEVTNIPSEKITVIYEGRPNFKVRSKKEILQFRKKYNLPEKFILAIGGVGERRNLFRIREAAKDYNLVVSGVDIPWLDEGELNLLYNSSEVLVYTSLYEGFGLPIVDAFSSGLPVITSNISAMPEVGGTAALYADPYNVSDIRKKIKIILEDNELRGGLIKKGFDQANKFSWEKCAKQTAEIYRKLISN